jgi:hypothetical protein
LLQWNNVIATMQQRADRVGDAAGREMVRQMADAMQSHPALIALGVWVVFTIVGIGMAALGGVIGVAIFEKRKGQPPSQPPYIPGGGSPSYGLPGSTPAVPTSPGQPFSETDEPPSI